MVGFIGLDRQNYLGLKPLEEIKKRESTSKYVRPSNWLTLPVVVPGDQKIYILVAVFNDSSNFVAFTIAGAYTVDWGDGTAPTNYATGVKAEKNYSYSSLNANTYCSRGYRQAIITITPQGGSNLTSITFCSTHSQSGLNANFPIPYLSINMAGSNISTLSVGTSSTTKILMLEEFNFYGTNSITNFSYCFQYCRLIKLVNIYTTSGTNFSYMFSGCWALQLGPDLVTTSGTNFSYMFECCAQLTQIPYYDCGSGINFSYMFSLCRILDTIPLLNTASGTNFSGMFSNCLGLTKIPLLNTANGTDFSSMFANCVMLVTIPLLNTGKGTTFANCFDGCNSLLYIPTLDTAKATSFVSMFNACVNLKSIPALNCTLVTSFTTFLSGMNSLSSCSMTNIGATISFASQCLGQAEIVTIFNNLKTTTGKTITITGNYGSALLTAPQKAIATGKGWTLVL